MKGRVALSSFGVQFLTGRVPEQSMRRLRLRLHDGRLLRVPTRDGFFLYEIPVEILAHTAPQALLAYDAKGRLVARELLPSEVPPMFFGPGLPPGSAELRHKHPLLTRPTSVGPATIWAAPSYTGPARCTWLQLGHAVYGGSCDRVKAGRGLTATLPLHERVNGKTVNVLWGHAGSKVGALLISFQDGSVRRLPIRGGVFLYVVPDSRWRVGYRPAFLIARDRNGHALRRRLLFEYTLAS